MNIVTRYSILDSLGDVIPAVEILHYSGAYGVENLITGDEITVNTLEEAEAVASAMRNRNQTNHDKGV